MSWYTDQLLGRDSFQQAGIKTSLPGGTPPDRLVCKLAFWEEPLPTSSIHQKAFLLVDKVV
jgi:hypothetical protein